MALLTELTEIIGFFSYSRDDDRDSDGALSILRRRIQNELRGQLGRSEQELRLWQDQEAIPPGTLWEGQIGGAIEQSVFFIPIITPRVINSRYCQIEFDRFLKREGELKRNDLIFPVLYIEIPELRDERQWREHPVLKAIGARQYVDWCDYRFDLDNPNVRRAIAAFCRTIVGALKRVLPDPRAEEEARVARQHEEEQARRRAEEARQRAEEQAAGDRETAAARQREEEQAARDREAAAARQRAEEQAAREVERIARERAEEQRKRDAAEVAARVEQVAVTEPAVRPSAEPWLLSQYLIGLLLIMQGVMGGNSTLVGDVHNDQIIASFDDVLYHACPLLSLLVGMRFMDMMPTPIARILPLIWLALVAGLLGLYYCIDIILVSGSELGFFDVVVIVVPLLGMVGLAFAARKTALPPGKLGLIAIGASWVWSALLFLFPGLLKLSPYIIDPYIGLVTFPLAVAWAVLAWRKSQAVANLPNALAGLDPGARSAGKAQDG